MDRYASRSNPRAAHSRQSSAERQGDLLDIVHAHITRRALDAADIAAVQTASSANTSCDQPYVARKMRMRRANRRRAAPAARSSLSGLSITVAKPYLAFRQQRISGYLFSRHNSSRKIKNRRSALIPSLTCVPRT
jgi:hypothetical protein